VAHSFGVYARNFLDRQEDGLHIDYFVALPLAGGDEESSPVKLDERSRLRGTNGKAGRTLL
jgi:hypothetical protein